jgi:hypothetical protein
MALRWKKNPHPRGLAGVVSGPQGSTLRDGEVRYATTGTYHFRDSRTGWYWVALKVGGVPYKNTCDEPLPDEAAAKAAALAYVREHLKMNKEQTL